MESTHNQHDAARLYEKIIKLLDNPELKETALDRLAILIGELYSTPASKHYQELLEQRLKESKFMDFYQSPKQAFSAWKLNVLPFMFSNEAYHKAEGHRQLARIWLEKYVEGKHSEVELGRAYYFLSIITRGNSPFKVEKAEKYEKLALQSGVFEANLSELAKALVGSPPYSKMTFEELQEEIAALTDQIVKMQNKEALTALKKLYADFIEQTPIKIKNNLTLLSNENYQALYDLGRYDHRLRLMSLDFDPALKEKRDTVLNEWEKERDEKIPISLIANDERLAKFVRPEHKLFVLKHQLMQLLVRAQTLLENPPGSGESMFDLFKRIKEKEESLKHLTQPSTKLEASSKEMSAPKIEDPFPEWEGRCSISPVYRFFTSNSDENNKALQVKFDNYCAILRLISSIESPSVTILRIREQVGNGRIINEEKLDKNLKIALEEASKGTKKAFKEHYQTIINLVNDTNATSNLLLKQLLNMKSDFADPSWDKKGHKAVFSFTPSHIEKIRAALSGLNIFSTNLEALRKTVTEELKNALTETKSKERRLTPDGVTVDELYRKWATFFNVPVAEKTTLIDHEVKSFKREL